MPSMSFEPLELIPMDAVPSTDVLTAGIAQPPAPRDRDYSDIFPYENYLHFQGMLGDYRAGDPPMGHPLHVASEGLRAAYNKFAHQEAENNFVRTEATSRGKVSTMLQSHIGSCIAKSYDNVAGTTGPSEAIQLLTFYAEEREATCTTDYNDELDYHTTQLALLDRGEEEPTPSKINGIPVISARDFATALGQPPESPEVERQGRKEHAKQQISIVRDRLVRVQFEYASALALTQLLKDAVSVS